MWTWWVPKVSQSFNIFLLFKNIKNPRFRTWIEVEFSSRQEVNGLKSNCICLFVCLSVCLFPSPRHLHLHRCFPQVRPTLPGQKPIETKSRRRNETNVKIVSLDYKFLRVLFFWVVCCFRCCFCYWALLLQVVSHLFSIPRSGVSGGTLHGEVKLILPRLPSPQLKTVNRNWPKEKEDICHLTFLCGKSPGSGTVPCPFAFPHFGRVPTRLVSIMNFYCVHSDIFSSRGTPFFKFLHGRWSVLSFPILRIVFLVRPNLRS